MKNDNRLVQFTKILAYVLRIAQDTLIQHLFKAQLSSSSRAST
jgi:hypothetical protein